MIIINERGSEVFGEVMVRLMKLLGVHNVVFFFQAEDGIRDVAGTGVQTCALPI